MGRVSSETNVLGTFTYTYVGHSGRLATVAYPNGQTSTYSYFGHTGDDRLQTIHHRYPNATTLSKFDYTYDQVGNILTWRQQADTNPATQYVFDYDAADELTRATNQTTDPTPAILKRYVYTYDRTGNRTGEQIDDALSGATYNNMNQLVSQQPSGGLLFAGTVNEPATVTINGTPATVKADNSFSAGVPVVAGTNTITIVAADASGNSATKQYDVDSTGLTKSFTYDATGNLTADGSRTFEWDAQNQLVAVNDGTHRSEFTYDGLSRRVRIVEKENAAVVSDQRFVWDGNDIGERRDNSGAVVTARLYRHGLQENGLARYLTRDHVMSIREATDISAVIQARYEYRPFGTMTTVAGTSPNLLGYTGVLVHEPSGLFLMKRRAYYSALARWLSEDPLGMHDGPNLYAYVADNPLRWIDPDGTVAVPAPKPPFQPNGNAWGGYTKQDNICSQPMQFLGFNGSPCTVKCCQAHDACYAGAHCNWTSWLTIAYESACSKCNRTAFVCASVDS